MQPQAYPLPRWFRSRSSRRDRSASGTFLRLLPSHGADQLFRGSKTSTHIPTPGVDGVSVDGGHSDRHAQRGAVARRERRASLNHGRLDRMSQGDQLQDGIPVVTGFIEDHDQGQSLRVWCRWCCRWHGHSSGPALLRPRQRIRRGWLQAPRVGHAGFRGLQDDASGDCRTGAGDQGGPKQRGYAPGFRQRTPRPPAAVALHQGRLGLWPNIRSSSPDCLRPTTAA